MSSRSVFLMQVARLVVVGWRAAIHGQQVGRERQKSFECDTPRDVLDMRVQSAVLMNDDHRRAFALVFRPRQIAVDLSLG
jgi:hypothetical protein